MQWNPGSLVVVALRNHRRLVEVGAGVVLVFGLGFANYAGPADRIWHAAGLLISVYGAFVLGAAWVFRRFPDELATEPPRVEARHAQR